MFEFRRGSSSPRIASAISTYNFLHKKLSPVFIGNVENGGIFYAKWHISCGLFHTKTGHIPLSFNTKPELQIHSISDNIKRTARQKKLVGRSIFRRIWRSMNYSFTEPFTSPAYICFCRQRNMISVGIIQITIPAKMISHFAP